MSINMEKMNAHRARIQNKYKDEKKESVFFKPQSGEQEIRFLPTPDGDPFKEYFFHYDLGPSFLCPKKNFNEKCAVCDYGFELWKEGTDESKKLAKKMFAKQRFFSNVLVRGKEEEGPKPYGYGKETYEQLIEAVLDPDIGDLTDPETGREIKLTYKPATTPGTFPKTKLMIKGSKALAKSKKEIADILAKAKPIESFHLRKTPAEVKAALEASMEDPYEGDESEVSRGGSTGAESSGDSVDEAIDELMKN